MKTASITVEASYIMILLLAVIFFILRMNFFLYDRCSMYSTAYEVSVRGAQQERLKAQDNAKGISSVADRKGKERSFFLETNVSGIQVGKNEVSVTLQGAKGVWKDQETGRCTCVTPEKWIRRSLCIKEIREQDDDSDL